MICVYFVINDTMKYVYNEVKICLSPAIRYKRVTVFGSVFIFTFPYSVIWNPISSVKMVPNGTNVAFSKIFFYFMVFPVCM